jgi:hypothetical protein
MSAGRTGQTNQQREGTQDDATGAQANEGLVERSHGEPERDPRRECHSARGAGQPKGPQNRQPRASIPCALAKGHAASATEQGDARSGGGPSQNLTEGSPGRLLMTIPRQAPMIDGYVFHVSLQLAGHAIDGPKFQKCCVFPFPLSAAILPSSISNVELRRHHASTRTPFQKAMYPAMFWAAGSGDG